MKECLGNSNSPDAISTADMEHLEFRLGSAHRTWIEELFSDHQVQSIKGETIFSLNANQK